MYLLVFLLLCASFNVTASEKSLNSTNVTCYKSGFFNNYTPLTSELYPSLTQSHNEEFNNQENNNVIATNEGINHSGHPATIGAVTVLPSAPRLEEDKIKEKTDQVTTSATAIITSATAPKPFIIEGNLSTSSTPTQAQQDINSKKTQINDNNKLSKGDMIHMGTLFAFFGIAMPPVGILFAPLVIFSIRHGQLPPDRFVFGAQFLLGLNFASFYLQSKIK